MINVKIRDIAVYHGSRIVDNDYYIEHFKKKQKDVSHFLTNIIGRKKRYMIDPDTDSNLSMAMKATKLVLEQAGLSGKDIDLIAYSSVLPEYTIPPCSIHLHEAIGGKPECICYDINVNCAGMTVCIEQIFKYMHLSEKRQYRFDCRMRLRQPPAQQRQRVLLRTLRGCRVRDYLRKDR